VTSIPAKFTKVTDEMRVADILASWSIEEIRQLIEEFEAELRRPAPPRGALRSRVDRADALAARADHPAIQCSSI